MSRRTRLPAEPRPAARTVRRALPPPTRLERLLIVLTALVVSVGAIAGLSGYFAGRDGAGVAGGAGEVGQLLPDQGDRVLAPGEPHPLYLSDPPASGPHRPEAIVRDRTALTVDQELEALALGNVVIAYGTAAPPPALLALQAASAGPFTPALALAGQAVVLDRLPGTAGVVAVSWRHVLRAVAPADPALRVFVTQRLGRSAPGRG